MFEKTCDNVFDANAIECVACDNYTNCNPVIEGDILSDDVLEDVVEKEPVKPITIEASVELVPSNLNVLTKAAKAKADELAVEILKHQVTFRTAWGAYMGAIGPLVVEVRDIFKGHPNEFDAWCNDKVGCTKATALMVVQTYTRFKDNLALVSDLNFGKVKALVTLKDPEKFIEKHKEDIGSVSVNKMRDIVKAYKASTPGETPPAPTPPVAPDQRLFRILRRVNDPLTDYHLEFVKLLNDGDLTLDDQKRANLKVYAKQLTEWADKLTSYVATFE